MSKSTILLAEDDENLRFVVQDNLELRGFRVIAVENGEDAFLAFQEGEVDLCIFDVMMPKLDGFALAGKVRELNSNVPIIFLTAKGLKEDRLQGFRMGGDDYLTKPFSIEELLFRVEVFLKRPKVSENPSAENIFKTRTLEFIPSQLKIVCGGETTSLTYKESELLEMFFLNQGQILKREDILMKIWGTDDYYKGRSLDVFISKVRKFLQSDNSLEIQTVHGVGFKFVRH
ncbi:MAG TPA: response regulator transcription factor [Catalimonadaceae bacterium]|nr:response regulator transcription factor [Catalimonadaceae bacterium]HPI11069.1 response regulator transcription factor [Catalimonadaceae bacterium]